MADPKYQDLPYIAVGEPDLYETGDLPEADQGLVDDTEQDQIVESIAVDPKKAFRRFNKATVDGSGTDFSGDQRGYSVHYELLPAGEEESILQKLQRIKSELKQINDSVKTNFNDPDVNPASILSEVESLQKDVDGISLSSIASQDANTAGYNKLLAELTSVASKSSPKKGTAGSSAQGATFELNYAPDAVVSAKGANLEARVAQLESLIGQPGDDKILAESVGGQTVMDAVATLSSKLHLLDEDKVDKLSARLQVLLQSLSKVSESSATTEARNMERINELYELVKKWDESSDSLPVVVDRLYALQELHQQAMEFSSSLKALESAQTELSTNVTNHNQLLGDMQKTFASNVDVIKNNVAGLEKRMNALK